MARLFLFLFLLSCGRYQDPSSPVDQAKLLQLKEIVDRLELPLCNSYVSKPDCDNGDSVLFAGLLCLSGETVGCDTVKDSYTPGIGFSRAPNRIDTKNEFSRDMALGVLAYLIKTKDKELAKAWLQDIQNKDNKLCQNPTDNRCNITSSLWALMGHVWKYIELDRTPLMIANLVVEDAALKYQALSAERGYPLHLTGIQLLLRQQVGVWSLDLQDAASSLVRREPQNPFFELILKGKNDSVLDKVLVLLPEQGNGKQWTWERTDTEQAWRNSMGWDYLFIYNMLAKDS